MRELALVMIRMANVSAEASAAIRNEAIRFARDSGASWAEVGVGLGLSKHMAWKRYHDAVGEPRMVERKRRDNTLGLPGIDGPGIDGS